jgi:PAS domain S-box-containing protein
MPDENHILYVDDEQGLLELGKLYLEEGGFSVDCEVSGKVALDRIASGHYNAIISDYQMPVMNGIELLKAVRQRFGNIPFILFTGRGREEVVIAAINNGADFYLQKGGDPTAQFAELAHKVRQAVLRRKSENEIVSIFRAVPVGIAVVADRVLVRVNTHLCTITGYPRQELEGRNTRFLYLNDEDYAAVGRMRDQAYRQGIPDSLEIPWRRKDGTIIDVRITAAAIDRSNPLAAMTYSALDITREKQEHNELRAAYEQLAASDEELRGQYEALASSERRIRENEASITSIFRAAPIAIAFLFGRTIVRANDRLCEITGYSLEEIHGKDSRFLYPDDEEFDRVGGLQLGGDTTGGPRVTETRWRRRDGALRDILLTGIAIDPSSPTAGRVYTAMDITDEKRAREELKKAYEKISRTEEKLHSR